MIQEETPLSNEDIRLLKSAGRITGIRWFLLLLFTAITLILAALLLMAACGRKAALYVPVSAAWVIVMAICFFMWRSALKKRNSSRRGLRTGKKRIVRARIKALRATTSGDLQYITTNNEIIEVRPTLPDNSFFYEQRSGYHQAIISNISGLTNQEIILHISKEGNVLLKAEYPHSAYKENTVKVSEDDQQLVREKQSTLVKLFLTGCTGLSLILLLGGIAKGYYSNLYIVIALIYVVFFLLAAPAYYVYNSYTRAESKVIIRGKVTEIMSTMRPNKGTGDVYYRVSDKLFLVRPIENLGTRVLPGSEVELHFVRKANGQPGRMLYDIKC
jgi:membrane protein implicated in regulation of membrane protease activity